MDAGKLSEQQPTTRADGRAWNSGSILIVVLWSVVMLSFFSISLGYSTRQKAALFDRISVRGELESLALAGIEKAREVLRPPDPEPEADHLGESWANNPAAFREVHLANGVFSVGPDEVPGLADEEQKININTADTLVISRLLKSVAFLDEEDALKIAYAIVDWRDTDFGFGHPDYGAEDETYQSLTPPYSSKDAPFESLDELLMVLGVTREIFDKIKPFVTVFGSGSVNVNTAGPEALTALGFGREFADRLVAYRNGTDQKKGTSDDVYFTDPSVIVSSMSRTAAVAPPDAAIVDQLVEAGKIGTLSGFFNAQSRAKLDRNGAQFVTEAVMNRDGKIFFQRSSPIKWHEDGAQN